MLVKPKFPRHRLHDPKRRAELAIYRALEASPMAGVALYEPRFGPYQRGLDFVVWLRDVGRFAIEDKGGLYCVHNGQWYLSTPSGWQEVDCPALQAWDGAMNFRDRIARKQDKGPFVVSVLVFPDMEPDPALTRALADSAVHVVFGVQDFTGQLAGLADIKKAPKADDITREVALVECAEPEPEAPETPETFEMGLHSGQVIIQHVDTLNVYSQVPAPLPAGAGMDRAARIQFCSYLLDRAEADRHTPETGSLLAARWASGSFAHALMAHSGAAMITEVPTSMYAAADQLDREAGGGERWRQAAYAAYEITSAFYSGGLPCDELDRKIELVVQAARELLARMEEETP